MPAHGSPVLVLLRVAALALALGLLAWFVTRASQAGHEAAAAPSSPSPSPAADAPPISVVAPRLAASSKVISQPLFSVKEPTPTPYPASNTRMVKSNGWSIVTYGDQPATLPTPTPEEVVEREPTLAPSSKSATFPIFSSGQKGKAAP